MNAKCDNCGTVYDEEDLKQVRKLHERVDPGGTMPSGECPVPDCGALCYPTNEDVSKVKLRLTLDVTYNPKGEYTENLKALMRAIAESAANDGLMTGEGPAEVDVWKAEVEEVQ